MTEQEATDHIDALQLLLEESLQDAADALEKLADHHDKYRGVIPRGYQRSMRDLMHYEDMAKLLHLIRMGMGEEGLTPSEDVAMEQALAQLGLTWRS